MRYRVKGTAEWVTFADGVSTATSATVTGLANGTTYQFGVAAKNTAGTGDFSATVQATPAATVLQVSPSSGSEIDAFRGRGTGFTPGQQVRLKLT